ncbi:MAG: tRNA (adenosine(37)-N6)-threonylcarbamoyltransferase complex dimerization subunit type 1 TsaB [Chthoniobacterales bacterium]
MRMLALELSSPRGSVASCGDNGKTEVRTFPADRKDSGLFYENLLAVYRESAPPDLIVVGLGPGSYAGVRIAIATALGLRLAAGARLRGLPSVCAIDREEYLFVGDARRNSFVFAHVVDGRCVEGPVLAREEEIRARLRAVPSLPVFATEPFDQFETVMTEYPSALRLIELARRTGGPFDETLEPIYLRAPYITTAAR